MLPFAVCKGKNQEHWQAHIVEPDRLIYHLARLGIEIVFQPTSKY